MRPNRSVYFIQLVEYSNKLIHNHKEHRDTRDNTNLFLLVRGKRLKIQVLSSVLLNYRHDNIKAVIWECIYLNEILL
jgi:hypothetical protein